VIGFGLISGLFISTAVISLKSSQTDNLAAFRNEFVELSRELFQNSANLFFDYFDDKVKDSEFKSKEDVMAFFQTIDPHGDNLVLIDLKNKTFVGSYDNPKLTSYLDQKTINKFVDQWTLNQKNDFEVDNYTDFLAEKNSLAPVQINMRFYEPLGVIVGYGKTFDTTKIRIDFINQKNKQYYDSFLTSILIIFSIIAILASLISILFMKRAIINPIGKLRRATLEISRGNLDAQIEIKAKDEIGELATAFSQMTGELKKSKQVLEDYNKKLEAEVKERTKDLEITEQKLKSVNFDLEDKVKTRTAELEKLKNGLEETVAQRTVDLNQKVTEVEKINKFMVDRELKMVELKKRISELEEKAGQQPEV
jgi:methyl-accepting chemotaxis protein